MASSNWVALKKTLPKRPQTHQFESPKKRRKIHSSSLSEGTSGSDIAATVDNKLTSALIGIDRRGPESVTALRRMVYGETSYPSAHILPGKYLAIDCEMVGIAGDPSHQNLRSRDRKDESSLARVSVVNYYGAVQLDVFVRQRERVTDWRTAVSGVRESDMVNAKSFVEVQKLVSDLLKDRLLVGHAVHNDLRVLMLSHPRQLTRDTQVLAARHMTLSTTLESASSATDTAKVKIAVNRRPGLRKLVIQELGIDIQAGEHSSVTDARATMAIYRLHRKIWDKGFKGPVRTLNVKHSLTEVPVVQTTRGTVADQPNSQAHEHSRAERELECNEDTDAAGPSTNKIRSQRPARKQKISSGLSVIVKRHDGSAEKKQVVSGTRRANSGNSGCGNTKWWGTLGN